MKFFLINFEIIVISLIVSFVYPNDFYLRRGSHSKLPKTPPMQFNRKPIKFKPLKNVLKDRKPVIKKLPPRLKPKSLPHKLPTKIKKKQLRLIPRPRPLGRRHESFEQ